MTEGMKSRLTKPKAHDLRAVSIESILDRRTDRQTDRYAVYGISIHSRGATKSETKVKLRCGRCCMEW